MIYRKGKRYITMRDGKIFDEAVSSILKVQLDEIRTYMETHEGITEIAENGTDWVFKFDPFPEKIIRYIYSRKHKLHLRYCYRGGHFGYGMGRLTKDDVVYKHVDLNNRTVLKEMVMPEINR